MNDNVENEQMRTEETENKQLGTFTDERNRGLFKEKDLCLAVFIYNADCD